MSLFNEIYSDKKLSSRAKIVYMNLQDRTNKDGICFPSLNRIASDTSLSKRTVQRAIDDLVKCGYLIKEKRVRENNGDTSNFYILQK